MKAERPLITFRVSIRTKASPDAVYDVLADLNSHLEWGGRQASSKRLRLGTLDAPSGPAVVGTRFSSTGAAGPMANATFHDRSVVVEAEPGRRFGFDTDSTLERTGRQPAPSQGRHRYAITASGDGAVISYTLDLRPATRPPYWLSAPFRPFTRAMANRLTRKNVRNLARMAESVGERVRR